VGGGNPEIAGLSRRAAITGALGVVAGGCQPVPDLAPGEAGRIVRAPDGDLVVLDSGLRVRLSEVEAPATGDFAQEARDLLIRAALGRPAQLYYGGLSRDRYDRAIAHIIVSTAGGGDLWVNGLMARQGGGRVRSWPDNARRVRQLYALEEEARRNRRGLWAYDTYRVRQLDDLRGAQGFQIVEGPLAAVRASTGRAVVRFGGQGIEIEPDGSLGKAAGLSLTPGRIVRIRGRLDAGEDGPAMRLTHWGQVETVD